VGDAYYLTKDFSVKCYTDEWAATSTSAFFGIVAYIVGIPMFLLYVMHKARMSGVASMCKTLDKGGEEAATLRVKLLNEVRSCSFVSSPHAVSVNFFL
jgi:hypothetical protein